VTGESWDPAWEAFFRETAGNRYPDPAIVRFVARNFFSAADRSKVHILDLGCGSGAHVWFAAREGFRTYGIDGSPTAIALAAERLEREGLRADLRQGELRALPYAEACMDVVLDGAAIQHNGLSAIRTIIAEVLRVLKPGGRFFGTMVAEDSLGVSGRLRTHFFARAEFPDLFREFDDLSVGSVEYVAGHGGGRQKFWLVEARKPAAAGA
jgi:SAM-dependent methyltransferase